MKIVKAGNLELGRIPRLAGVVTELVSMDQIQCLQDHGVTILELRVDLMDQPMDRILAYIQTLRDSGPFTLLGTVRETQANRTDRLDLFKQLIPAVDAIDIEWDASITRDVIQHAAKHRKAVIVSHHDFQKTPDFDSIKDIMDRSEPLGGDIIKIAVTPQSEEDVTALLLFTWQYREKGLVTIAMGNNGNISRIASPLFGSMITYGFITQSAAPGQFSVQELHRLFCGFYPSYQEDFLKRKKNR